MKFKVIYEYFDIVHADSMVVNDNEIAFVSDEKTSWIPKYMIKKIVPVKEFEFDDGKDN